MTPEQASQHVKRALLSLKVVDMIGEIKTFITEFLPENVLPLEGGTYAREDYPILYNRLPYIFIINQFSFFLPDTRGQFVRGTHITHIGENGGQASVTLDVSQMPLHTHNIAPHAHAYVGAAASAADFGTGAPVPSAVPSPAVSEFVPLVTDTAGGNSPVDLIPPFLGVRYGIVAR